MLSCSNNTRIKRMSHAMKIWTRVREARLKREAMISEQCSALSHAEYEYYRCDVCFVDLEKTSHRVPREELWYGWGFFM